MQCPWSQFVYFITTYYFLLPVLACLSHDWAELDARENVNEDTSVYLHLCFHVCFVFYLVPPDDGSYELKHVGENNMKQCNTQIDSRCILFDIQWNSLKKNPVKKISRLRSQDKKAQKFSHFFKITLLRNFPLKK
jgi:hypothetical protein